MNSNSANNLNFIQTINSFSIWVAMGALVTYVFYSKLFGFEPNIFTGLCLAITTWIIYTMDHLLDAKLLDSKATAIRHLLHAKYRRQLVVIVFILGAIVLSLSFFKLDIQVIRFGLLIFGFTIVHFLVNFFVSNRIKEKVYLKEFMIAFVVTLAFGLLPIREHQFSHIGRVEIFILTHLFLLNLINVLLFSLYDSKQDLRSGLKSGATVYGLTQTKTIVGLAFLFCFISLGMIFFHSQELNTGLFVLVVMTIFLLAIWLFPSLFAKNDRFRFWGDFIYVLPILGFPFL